ncbi:MAG: malto-oligosyltrehalose trehalohydrolase [Chloroflexi bacterium]|nr:MAG: malto-oligosyltrehalose trehalohydrolase [Chloroflexota bacterium]
MHQFRVWAPGKQRVDLVSGASRALMTEFEGGWWEGADAAAGPGTRYGFAVEGGDTRPDPRSASQPDGVLGLSEVVDHELHSWTDARWNGLSPSRLILYELHVGTFSPAGTFDGVIDHLPHLVALGVDAIELMPVAEFSGNRGWGYDGVDFFAPHHAYGGPAGLKRLVDSCHAAGLGVVLDVVYNHAGPVGNYLGDFGPYFTERHRTAWGAPFNFDGNGSGEVRRFVVDNALMWIRDYHIDGLRLDAVHAIVDDSPLNIFEQLATEVHAASAALHRSVLLFAETDANDPRLVRARDAGGYGLDAAWADDWHHALHVVLTGERTGYYEDFTSPGMLAKALRQAWVYDGVWSHHRQKIRGAKPAGVPPNAFVVAAQNHDQVGNRAAGDRLAALVDEGRLKAAAALLLTTPFTPLLFQGEEWAASTPFLYFTAHADPVLGNTVSEGRRREFAAFGWNPDDVPDPQDPRTFEQSKLKWDELDEPYHRRMLGWYRDLIALRRRMPAVAQEVNAHVDGDRIVFERDGVVVSVNLCVPDCTEVEVVEHA